MTFRTKFSEEACLFYISSLSKRGVAPVFFHKSEFSMKNFHLLHWGVGIFFHGEGGFVKSPSLKGERFYLSLKGERFYLSLKGERFYLSLKGERGIRRLSHILFLHFSLSPRREEVLDDGLTSFR